LPATPRTRILLALFCLASLLVFMASCSSDDPAGPNTGDNTEDPLSQAPGDQVPSAPDPTDQTPTDGDNQQQIPEDEIPVPPIDSNDPTPPLFEPPAEGVEPGLLFPEMVELLNGQLAPRDLIFGPEGTDFADELFVVNFASAEAVWIVDFEQESQSVGTVQSSLVGAIAVDADSDGRFYFACLLPAMGANIGVITVRTISESVPDFQYEGLMTPTGVALDADGGLFVANRDRGSVVRVDFADGRGRDQHAVTTIAQNLAFGTEDLPNHMQVDRTGRLLICETAADQIRVWDPDNGLEIFAGSDLGLNRPVGIAQRPNGNILITNQGNGHIVELNAAGQLVNLIETDLGDGQLYGIAVRADNRVYVIGGRSIYRVDGI
jgi:hypothetical protein